MMIIIVWPNSYYYVPISHYSEWISLVNSDITHKYNSTGRGSSSKVNSPSSNVGSGHDNSNAFIRVAAPLHGL